MRLDFSLLAFLGLANASALLPRQEPEEGSELSGWRPKTRSPHFFYLKVNDRCDPYSEYPEQPPKDCPMEGYAVRLEKGIAIATPYNKWWDPKLPTFFVDDDTQLYTVSKEPLQMYIDAVTGALKYTKVGYLPPSAVSTSFYHTGNNPLGMVDPSPAYLTWPSTYGIAFYGEWLMCPLGSTGQYQIFVNNQNFEPQGVEKDYCRSEELAAINANPWKKERPHPYPGGEYSGGEYPGGEYPGGEYPGGGDYEDPYGGPYTN